MTTTLLMAMDTTNWQSIQSKLPTIFEAITDIYRECSKPGSTKMKTVVNQYTTALISQWVKSFGSNHVLSRPTVKKRLEKLISTYHNKVYIKSHRSTGKKKRFASSPEGITKTLE